MKGKHLAFLLERSRLSQANMAQILDVSQRTVAKWLQERDTDVPKPYACEVRIALENYVLSPIVRKCNQTLFSTVPSEFVAIWLVRDLLFPMLISKSLETVEFSHRSTSEVVLIENTARYQCLKNPEERRTCHRLPNCSQTDLTAGCYYNDRAHKDMFQRSGTAYPLQSGLTLNLVEIEIENFKFKRTPGKRNVFYADGFCHSLLHVPFFIQSTQGPKPVLLVSLENKLRPVSSDANAPHYEVIGIPAKQYVAGQSVIYTQEDISAVEKQIRALFEEELRDLLACLDYIPDSLYREKTPDKSREETPFGHSGDYDLLHMRNMYRVLTDAQE